MLEVAATINVPATVAWRLLTHWAEGSYWSWTVAGISATGHLIEATGPDSCRVTFTIPAWAPFYVPLCRAALRAIGRLATRVEQ